MSRRLCVLKRIEGFKYHPKCKRTYTIASLFAYDLLVFSYAEVKSIRLIQQHLEEFSVASGLCANYDKSAIYTLDVSDEVQQELSRILKMHVSSLPFRYLGVLLSHKKLTVSKCMPLVESITSKVNHWTCKSLTYVGRVILIKSVLSGMKAYCSRLFILPKKGNMAWITTTKSLRSGGLGIHNFYAWNKDAILKKF